MNAFDQALMQESQFHGFFSSIKKAVKKVVKKTVKAVKTTIKAPEKVIRKTINDPKHILNHLEEGVRESTKAINHVRTAVQEAIVPAKLRKEINKAGAKVANNKIFRAVATAVASAYGVGLAANAAFSALDAYNNKLLIENVPVNVPLEQSLSPTEIKEVNESLAFLIPMSQDDQFRILKTLSPSLQGYAGKYLRQHKNDQPDINALTSGKIATTEGFNAGVAMGQEAGIKNAIAQLQSQGYTPQQIASIIQGSDFFKQTAPAIKTATMVPFFEAQYGNTPIGRELAVSTAQQVKTNLSVLPVIGGALLLGLTL